MYPAEMSASATIRSGLVRASGQAASVALASMTRSQCFISASGSSSARAASDVVVRISLSLAISAHGAGRDLIDSRHSLAVVLPSTNSGAGTALAIVTFTL